MATGRQPLAGLRERVEQILRQVVDPPLSVATRVIESEADSSVGYVVVTVPPSPVAPHMVDGSYYGRNDCTKYRLSDAEVLRLHARREPVERIARAALDEEISRDHVPLDDRTRGHLYAVAQPVTAPPGLARGLLAGGAQTLRELLRTSESSVAIDLHQFRHEPTMATDYTPTAQGAAMRSFAATGPGRTLNAKASEESLLDIEFREDGGQRLLLGCMTCEVHPNSWDEPRQVIMDGFAVAYAFRMALWAAEVGSRSGYHGTWVLGIHADRLRGLSSWVHTGTFGNTAVLFDANDYREVTTASHLELVERPYAVVDRLVGRLLRGLGTERNYSDVLRQNTPET